MLIPDNIMCLSEEFSPIKLDKNQDKKIIKYILNKGTQPERTDSTQNDYTEELEK